MKNEEIEKIARRIGRSTLWLYSMIRERPPYEEIGKIKTYSDAEKAYLCVESHWDCSKGETGKEWTLTQIYYRWLEVCQTADEAISLLNLTLFVIDNFSDESKLAVVADVIHKCFNFCDLKSIGEKLDDIYSKRSEEYNQCNKWIISKLERLIEIALIGLRAEEIKKLYDEIFDQWEVCYYSCREVTEKMRKKYEEVYIEEVENSVKQKDYGGLKRQEAMNILKEYQKNCLEKISEEMMKTNKAEEYINFFDDSSSTEYGKCKRSILTIFLIKNNKELSR